MLLVHINSYLTSYSAYINSNPTFLAYKNFTPLARWYFLYKAGGGPVSATV